MKNPGTLLALGAAALLAVPAVVKTARKGGSRSISDHHYLDESSTEEDIDEVAQAAAEHLNDPSPRAGEGNHSSPEDFVYDLRRRVQTFRRGTRAPTDPREAYGYRGNGMHVHNIQKPTIAGVRWVAEITLMTPESLRG